MVAGDDNAVFVERTADFLGGLTSEMPNRK